MIYTWNGKNYPCFIGFYTLNVYIQVQLFLGTPHSQIDVEENQVGLT